MVKKNDGSYRPCGDFRRLNTITEPDHYPLPNIADITNVLGKAKIFSKIDLLKGYNQVPIHPSGIPKTAICTPFGTYTFNFTCFGLRNAGAIFQRLMYSIFRDVSCIIFYVDDLLIFSPSIKQHAKDVKKVLKLLKGNGLIVHPDKCIWAQEEVEFLGHRITAEGMLPQPSKVAAIRHFPQPKTVKALQQFNGLVNYYHRFIPKLAEIMAPLYEVLKGKPRKLQWTPQLTQAFNNTKKALTSASLLSYPINTDKLILTSDASDVAIGAVLEQDGPLPFSVGNYPKPRRNTPPSIKNC